MQDRFSDIARLAEIEAARRQHVDALSCLADEAQRILTEMAGAGENTAMASFTTPDAPEHPAIAASSPAKTTTQHLLALKRAAGDYGMSDRRMKRWAAKTGALRKLSGRLMVDVSAL